MVWPGVLWAESLRAGAERLFHNSRGFTKRRPRETEIPRYALGAPL